MLKTRGKPSLSQYEISITFAISRFHGRVCITIFYETLSLGTYTECVQVHVDLKISSAGLTIVAKVSIATGPELLGAPLFFVLNCFFIRCKG